MEKNSEVYRRNNNGPKTLPCGTPDTTLTNLLRHPSTKTNCDRLDKNCVSTDNTTTDTNRAEPMENSLMVDPIKRSAEVYLHNPGLLQALQMHSAVYVTHTKAHHKYPNLSDKQTGWLEAHHSVP